MRRRCPVCEAPTMSVAEARALPGAPGSAVNYRCEGCGTTTEIMSPIARGVFYLLTVFFVAAVPWVLFGDRVARASDRPPIVAIVALMAIALGALLWRDGQRQRRFPPA